MAAPTENYIDPLAGATNGNDHGGAAFVDGSFANATLTLTKIGAFPAATCQAGDKIYLDDNGSGQVTAGLYTISVRTDNDNVVLAADIRSGAPDPVDVRCDQHTGAVGLPWATTQHCADFTTRDAANGDQFNVRDTAADVLAAALDLTTYGSPTAAAPLVIRGYTTAADDGGTGELDGDANDSIVSDGSYDYIVFVDMHLHNCAGNTIVFAGDFVEMVNCELDDSTASGFIGDDSCKFFHCNFHNIGAVGINADSYTQVLFCTFENGANDFTTACRVGRVSTVMFNIVVVDGASDGIMSDSYGANIGNNSVYAAGAATGTGISTGNKTDSVIINNLVEGFSGVGGIGIETTVGGKLYLYGYNQVYDCTAEYSIGGDVIVSIGNNETLIASPFVNAGAGDLTPIAGILGDGWPDDFLGTGTGNYLDPGAVQAEAGGGDVVGWW